MAGASGRITPARRAAPRTALALRAGNGAPTVQSLPNGQPAEARIQSIARAKAILDILARADGGWVPLRSLAAGTGLVKATVFNLVTALSELGLVEHDPRKGAYRLGLHALVYGRAVERRLDIAGALRPFLVRLCAETRETVNLALPCPTDVVIVDSLEGSQSLRVTSYAGTRALYHSTACGRALLAHQPEQVRRQILRDRPLVALTPKTTTAAKELEAILADCRRDGFACEVEENELGAACVAAPVFATNGDATAAVSIAGPVSRMTPTTRQRIGQLLKDTLAGASAELATLYGAGRAAP